MVVHAIHFDALTSVSLEFARHLAFAFLCWVMLVRARVSVSAVSVAPVHARHFCLSASCLRRNVLRFLRLLFFAWFIQSSGRHFLHLLCESLHLFLVFL